LAGTPLAGWLVPASAAAVRAAFREERWHDLNPLPIVARGRQFGGIIHRHDGAASLELEANPAPPPATPHTVREALISLQRVRTLAELGEVVVQQMRRVTGFERVL